MALNSILGIVFVLIIIVAAAFAVKKYRANAKEYERVKQARRQRIIEESRREEQKKRAEELKLNMELEEKYGKCSKVIPFSIRLSGMYKPIRIFTETKTILLQDRPYKFEDILGAELHDDSRVVTSEGEYKTESNTLGTIGRAIVGGMVAGEAGAIVGALSGTKNDTVSPATYETIHLYTLYINVRDIDNPIVTYKMGGNYKLALEILSVINVISAEAISGAGYD